MGENEGTACATGVQGKCTAAKGAEGEERADKGGAKRQEERMSCTPRTPRLASGMPGIAALGFGPAFASPAPWSLVLFPSPML